MAPQEATPKVDPWPPHILYIDHAFTHINIKNSKRKGPFFSFIIVSYPEYPLFVLAVFVQVFSFISSNY